MTREEFHAKYYGGHDKRADVIYDEIHACDAPVNKAEYWREKCMEWRNLALKQVEETETLPHHLVFDGQECTLAECRPGLAIELEKGQLIIKTDDGGRTWSTGIHFKHLPMHSLKERVRPVRLAPGAVPVEDATAKLAYYEGKIAQLRNNNSDAYKDLEAAEVENKELRDKLSAAEAERCRLAHGCRFFVSENREEAGR